MELYSDEERLRKLALRATGLVGGGTVVYYAWRNERIRAYVYRFRRASSDSIFLGLAGSTAELTGSIDNERGFTIEKSNLAEGEIAELEDSFTAEE